MLEILRISPDMTQAVDTKVKFQLCKRYEIKLREKITQSGYKSNFGRDCCAAVAFLKAQVSLKLGKVVSSDNGVSITYSYMY